MYNVCKLLFQVATFLLQSLAIADIFVLTLSYVVLSVICGLLPFMNHQELTGMALPYLIKYINPFGYIAHSWAIWITVLIAVNRFVAITKPLSAPFLCTLKKARLQVLLIIVLGVLFNLPRFFQNDIVYIQPNPNSTVTIASLNSTVIGDHTIFGKIYTNALYTICVLILPLFILTIVNYKLIKEIRKAKQLRDSMSATPTKNTNSSGEENNVTLVMVIIVVVFLLCHTPDRILQIVIVTLPQLKPKCGGIIYYLSDVVNLLIIINSSTNFVIYYFLRKRFRKILMTRICAFGTSVSASTPSWSRCKVDGNELSLLPELQLQTPQKVQL